MPQNKEYKGVAVMLLSAFLTSTGQLCWKLTSTSVLFLLVGFGLYGFGALLMVTALQYGDLSALHPLLSVGYILSIVLGKIILKESVSLWKIAGIAVIVIGLILICSPEKEHI